MQRGLGYDDKSFLKKKKKQKETDIKKKYR